MAEVAALCDQRAMMIVFMPLAWSAQLAAAVPPPGEPKPDIIVTGRALPREAGAALYDQVDLDRAEIQSTASGRLEDALRSVAGVSLYRRARARSSHPTANGLTMRALGGNSASRALLVVDGVPQSDPFGGWVDFAAFDLGRIAYVRVTRGGGSSRWGSGALAGMVEIDSLGPDAETPVAGEVRGGSRGSVDSSIRFAHGSSTAFVTAGAAFSRGDGFIPVIAADRGPADRRAPYRQGNLAVRGGLALTRAIELQSNLSAFDDRRQRGLPDSTNRNRGIDGSLRLVGRGPSPFQLTAYAQRRRFASQFAAAGAGRATSRLTLDQYAVPASGWGVRWQIEPLGSSVIHVRLGGDFRAVSGETRERFLFVANQPTRERRAGGRNLVGGVFAQTDRRIGALDLDLSARIDLWRIGRGHLREQVIGGVQLSEADYSARTGAEPSGRAAIGWDATPRLRLRAAAYRGWRLPTLNELYRPFRIGADAVAANAALDPETLIGAEAGAKLAISDDASIGATLFAARLDHAIANVTLVRGPGVFPGVGFVAANGTYSQRRNLRAIVSRGIELDAKWRRGALDGRLSASFAHARVLSNGDSAALNGKPPAQTPGTVIAATLGWSPSIRDRLSLTGRYVSSQFEDDLGKERLTPAFTIDGSGRIGLKGRLGLTAAVENLFNRRIESGIGSDGSIERAQPRTLWLGLSLQ